MTGISDAIVFVVVITTLISASISDLKKREASDVHWSIMGAFGILYITYEISGQPRWEYVLLIIGTVMILYDILADKERRALCSFIFYAIMALMFIVPIVSSPDDPFIVAFMTVPISFIMFVSMYHTGMIKGGADVKCLIVLAIIFRSYPSFSGYPLISIPDIDLLLLIFHFSLTVLFCASIFSLSIGLYYFIINIIRKDIDLPYMLLGFRMNINDARTSFVWPLQKIENDVAVKTTKAQDPEILTELEAIGTEKIWVTPMIPFLIPITIAVVFVLFIGNPLFLLFT